MLIAAIILFILAAILGLTLLGYILGNKPTPKALAFIHGPLALVGIILLIIYTTLHGGMLGILATTLFILTALGGSFLFYKDMTGQSVPKTLAVGHGSLAIISFILVIAYLMV